MKKLIILIILVSTCTHLFGQGKLTIDKVNGQVQYYENGMWKDAKGKVAIEDNTRIKLGQNSSCVAISGSGSKFCSSKTGMETTLNSNDMEESLLSRIYNTLGGLFSDTKKQGATSMYRGDEYLMLFPADGEVLSDTKFDFTWTNDHNNTYNFFLLEKTDPINWLCNKAVIKDTCVPFSKTTSCTAAKKLNATKKYHWSVRPSFDETSKSYFLSFSFADGEKIKILNEQLAQLEKDKTLTDPEAYEVLKATIYYNLKMYTESYKVLAAAKNKYPNSNFINTGYQTLIATVSELNQRK